MRLAHLLAWTVVIAVATDWAAAQGKKGAGKVSAVFEVYKDRGGKFRYRLKTVSGQSLAIASSGKKTEKELMDAIAMIRKHAAKAPVVEEKGSAKAAVHFQIYKDKSKKYRFRILAGRKSLGRSSIGYQDKKQAIAVIEAIRASAAAAQLRKST